MTPSDGSAAAPVPLLDLRRQFEPLADEIAAALVHVARSGRYVLGPECTELEQALASYLGVPHAIACASGSDALLLALLAAGVGPGDEVIVPSYTFFATASAVARLGARPVFADIDPQHYLLDPQAMEALFTPRTKAVIPVHLYGQCVDLASICASAAERGIPVIEDAAQAIGAEYAGRRAGGVGQIGCFSFYPTKNLGGLGDGGLVTTTRDDLAQRLRLLRVHGMEPRYHHQLLGINSRLDTLQAAVLLVKLPHLEGWTESRRAVAARYAQQFRAAGLDGLLQLPSEIPGRRHVWNQYVVRAPQGQRDALRAHLTARQIGTEIYYPIALHQQRCLEPFAPPAGALPETERATQETLALPMFPELTEAEQEIVVSAVRDFFAHAPRKEAPRPPQFVRRGAPQRSESRS